MCKIIAIANQKGGVAKTTTTINLGVGLSKVGKRVMLIDADPQGHLTMGLGFPKNLRVTLKTMMENIIMGLEFDPREAILHHEEGIDVIPSNKLLSGMDMSLFTVEDREKVLKEYLELLENDYDYILIDCMEDMKDETAQILSVKKEKKKVQPPKLYDLTTLQREANRLLGFTAQQTLDYTQSLYEKKLVTYPRTDSQYLTDDMEENALLVVGAVNSMFPEMSIKGSEPDIKRILNSKKVSDHHAIIPTVEITNMDLKALPGGEKKILMLIASKLLCASEQEYIYESIKTEISCHGELFTASGKNVLQ